MTIYRSSNSDGLVQLSHVQAELYEHLIADAGGRCLACGTDLEPCRRRAELTNILLSRGQLPRRQPGRTKAGLRRKAT